ncbi:MAG: hypothetical protein P8I82_06190 [Flavobacteriales bacterium]|nr:hypothetical protein [Flavobacteriales bacterium]
MKKLLQILSFIPLMCYCQSDKLVLVSGDTLSVKIVEMGVKNIKYTHLGEDLNYFINRKKIIKIIHDSGRVDIINNRLSNKLGRPPKNLFETNFSSNKIGLLGGGNYFSESIFQGLGVTSTLIYESHLYKIAHITGEVFFSFNSLYQPPSVLSGNLHRFGLFIGPSIKLQDNIIRAFFRVGITRDKYIIELDKSQLSFGDQIDPNYGFVVLTAENLGEFPDNINDVDNFIIYKFGLDGFYRLYKNLNLEYSLGYMYANKRDYEIVYLSSRGGTQNLSSINFTLGISYNIERNK